MAPPFAQLGVFTDTPTRGNPLVVVATIGGHIVVRVTGSVELPERTV